MKTGIVVTLRRRPVSLLILLLLPLVILSSAGLRPAAPARAAVSAVTVRLGPLGGSRIRGTVTLTAQGSVTRLVWHVRGMAPRRTLLASLHAGTCTLPSASFRVLAALTADTAGRATVTIAAPFTLPFLTDGEHILMLRAAACGAIPPH